MDGTFVISDLSFPDFRLSAYVAVVAVAAIGYLISFYRRGKTEFTVIDALILAVTVCIDQMAHAGR